MLKKWWENVYGWGNLNGFQRKIKLFRCIQHHTVVKVEFLFKNYFFEYLIPKKVWKSRFLARKFKYFKIFDDVNVRKRLLCHKNQFSSVFRFLFFLSWFSSGKNLWSILQYIFFILAWFSTIKLDLFYFILSVSIT